MANRYRIKKLRPQLTPNRRSREMVPVKVTPLPGAQALIPSYIAILKKG